MKKDLKKKSTGQQPTARWNEVKEPDLLYKPVKAYPVAKLKDFTYHEFKKIADKSPFTQAEWAAIMHVSERTLQRYAKSNGSFAPINAERAIQIAKLLEEGKATFGDVDTFYSWLRRGPYMLEGNLSLESLTTTEGIDRVLTQLGRIQHGLFA
jgi:putative toxin-antitoxin system antitoxin component (TIGR02293 family)